jgi:hypothetical protein
VCLEDVKEICKLRDDVYRNRWITFAYWSLSQRFRRLIDEDSASWCAFSTWSSRTVGESLRLDKATRYIEELVEDDETSVSDSDHKWLLQLQYRLTTRDAGAAQLALAIGNHHVFHEIGYAMADFLDWVERNPARDDDAWVLYRETIKPYEPSDPELFPPADVEQLRSALECYYRARYETNPKLKAELVLRGNVLLAAYEQWRLEPLLKVALEPFPGRFVQVVRTKPGVAATLSILDAGTSWALRHRSPILRAASAQFGAAMTQRVMALDVPSVPDDEDDKDEDDKKAVITPIRLGGGIPLGTNSSFYPAKLEELHDTESLRLFGVYDRSNGKPGGSASQNWTRYPDRMNFIVNLFRARQLDPSLYRSLPGPDLDVLDLDMSDDRLDELRQMGDNEIDSWIEEQEAGSDADPRGFVEGLAAEGGLRDLLAANPPTPQLPEWAHGPTLERGQKFFRAYGAEIGSALFSASLPISYTAGRGARVLGITAALASNTERRIARTGMMLLAAMAADDSHLPPLDPNTSAYRAARGVRLFHGAVRRMVTQPDLHWNKDELGRPVNQEDLLGTLAVFTVVVIESLDKMGVTCKVEDRNAYFHLWLAVGALLGIDYDLLHRGDRPRTGPPLTYAEMQLLARIIFERNAQASPAGQELTAALLGTLERSVRFPFKGLPRAVVRRLIGEQEADMLGIPPPGVMRLAIAALRPVNAVISPALHSNALAGLTNRFTRKLYREWIERQDGSSPVWLDPFPVRVVRNAIDAARGFARHISTQSN